VAELAGRPVHYCPPSFYDQDAIHALMKDGDIVKQGKHADLLAANGLHIALQE
jgi:hypothetical protein